MNKLFTIMIIALFAAASIPAVSAASFPSYGWPAGACTHTASANGCYGGNCAYLMGWGYGYAPVKSQYTATWAPRSYKYHYPSSQAPFGAQTGFNQWPGPYGHSYTGNGMTTWPPAQ